MQRKGIVTQFRLGQVVAKPGILDAVPRGELAGGAEASPTLRLGRSTGFGLGCQ